MPDLRFLSEATFIIGCGVGFLSGTLVSWTLHAWTLAGMETDRPFEGGRLKAFEKEKRWNSSENLTSGSEQLVLGSTPDRLILDGHARRTLQDTSAAKQTSGNVSRNGSTASRSSGCGYPMNRRPEITPLNLNRNQERRLVWLILNETTRNANDLPREDVELKLETLARYRFGSKVRRRVRDEIVEKRLGWKDDAGTVYLNRHKAREFVARARRAGVIGGR